MEGSESAVNAPHPDAEDESELFFGGEDEDDGDGEEAAAADAAEAAAADDAGDADGEQAAAPEPAAEEPKPAASEPKADPTPPAASGGPTEPASGDGATPDDKKSGQLEREYVVLQRVPLTKAALEHLLKEVTDGKDARVAFLEVQRPTARNDRVAIGMTYKAHRKQLGGAPEMVAVSARSFKQRKVKPKEKPIEETLEIS